MLDMHGFHRPSRIFCLAKVTCFKMLLEWFQNFPVFFISNLVHVYPVYECKCCYLFCIHLS